MPWKTTSHKEQRWRFIQEYLRHKTSLHALSGRWGISRKTAYKWVGRFQERGRFGLGDHSHAAHQVFNRPSRRWLSRIRRWRNRHPYWGAPKLHWVLKRRFGAKGLPSESAISRWLKKWKLTRKRRRLTYKGPVIGRPELTIARQANEVWTVDFKGWFRTGEGIRVEPLTVRDLASRYILAIDLLGRQNIRECRRSFERIFRQYGLPRVIRADNGSPFGAIGALGLTRLSAWWLKLGIGMEFIEPGHPEQNGAHEQFHRVYQQETLQPPARSLRAQKMRSERWRQQYNQERPHEGLGMSIPAEHYRKSQQRMPAKLKAWRYPSGWESRLVKSHGMISFGGKLRFIGEAFEGERMGLKRKGAGVWEVYFGPTLVGELWNRDAGGIRALRYRKKCRAK